VSHPRFLEFVAPGVTKGFALRWLAHHSGIPLAATMAIGDQLNDLEMIRAAGVGVAMAGAPAVVQEAARLIAPPAEEDGVALIIEEWILAEPPARHAVAAG
jgi:hypothetical protein